MNMIKLLLLTSLLTLGCNKPSEQSAQEQPSAPVLVSVSPENGTTGIKESTLEVVLTFDQNVRCPYLQQKNITAGDAKIEKVYAYNKTVTVSLSNLVPSSSYTITIPKGTISNFKDSPVEEITLRYTTADKESEPGYDQGEYPVPDPSNVAWQISDKLGIGWNLGNHFDAHNNGLSGETFWGNPKATQTTFNKVKAAGFKTVRIPVTWLGHIGQAPDYKIDQAWLDRVAEVVGYAEAAGLNAIVNIHHDGGDSQHWLDIKNAALNPEVHQRILDQVSAMWTQIAEKFKDKGDFLIFEAFNEIHDGGWGWGANRNDGGKQYRCLSEWNQAFVDAVRAVGGENADRLLGIPAYCTNVDIAIESFVWPEDTVEDKLMLSVHCYDPYTYTLEAQYSEWGHTAAASKKFPGDNENDLKKVFEKIYSHYISKGLPVYMGEFGCVNRATAREQAFQQYYLKYYAKLAKIYGVPSVIWDNGASGAGRERHAFFNHATGDYCSMEAKAAIEALVSSYTNTLTLDDVYNNAPK